LLFLAFQYARQRIRQQCVEAGAHNVGNDRLPQSFGFDCVVIANRTVAPIRLADSQPF
jgi:hypothetical protein